MIATTIDRIDRVITYEYEKNDSNETDRNNNIETIKGMIGN
jgi:hypothetical protein